MGEYEFQELVTEKLYEAEYYETGVEQISSFQEAGICSGNKGLVITMEDGSEFQVTIVQSREARDGN